jgi:hypothetical protein
MDGEILNLSNLGKSLELLSRLSNGFSSRLGKQVLKEAQLGQLIDYSWNKW